jgi:predicted lipoprotein
MIRSLPLLIGTCVVAIICWLFPPFHVRSLSEVRDAQAGARFNAPVFAEQFWNERLLPSLDQAADAEKVLAALADGPKRAREQFGRTVGISSSFYLFVRGTGRVVTVDEEQIGLSLKTGGEDVDIVVLVGLVFGNAVRDGTGLLDSSAFPNSQEFNAISAALNEIVETKVLPEWQRVAIVGKRLQFAGCVGMDGEDEDWKPLQLVPIFVRIE